MDGLYNPIVIEVAPGELVDKITIIEIKSEFVKAPQQLRAIQYEYAGLLNALEEALATEEIACVLAEPAMTNMGIVLPDEGQFEAVQSALDQQQFDAIRQSLAFQTVQLAMPRFEFETSLDLSASLEALGMVDVFDPDLADLTGMFDPASVDQNLFVSAALHKAYIGVDEAGTEAAAATAIIVGVMSAPVEVEPIVLRLDRPFIYTIYDRQTGSILFLGQVMNPAS